MAADNAKPVILTAEALLAAADTPEEIVDVPEWGGAVRIRGLTKQQQHEIRQRSVIAGALDENLVQRGIFKEGVIEPALDDDQIVLLWQKNAGVVDRVLTRVLVLSGMDLEAAKKAEATFRQGA